MDTFLHLRNIFLFYPNTAPYKVALKLEKQRKRLCSLGLKDLLSFEICNNHYVL